MIDDIITSEAPINVLIVGISSQIKSPKDIANINPKYLRGVTRETSDNLYDWLNNKLAVPPNKPIVHNSKKSLKVGMIHPNGIDKTPTIVIAKEKKNEINQTGSVDESFLIVIATQDIPIQKIIGNM